MGADGSLDTMPETGQAAERRFADLDGAAFPDFAAGEVWLVGAGPGAPGLLTLLAYHALKEADTIVYDALVGERILGWARADAQLVYAGKRGGKPSPKQRDITERLIAFSRAGRKVLRLKGGDPFIFGRGGEEVQGLARAGVPFRIVPGVSSGIGGLAYAGIPATHRDTNHAVTFLTGHDASGQVPASVDWHAVARATPVVVMYMAVKNLATIAAKLIDGGRAGADPVAVVARATLPDQEIVTMSLAEASRIEDPTRLPTPAIVVVGRVVDLSADLHWFAERLRGNGIG